MLDPRISLDGLLFDAEKDHDSEEQIKYIRECKARLEAHYNAHYGPPAYTSGSSPSSSSGSSPAVQNTSDPMSRYRRKQPMNSSILLSELERYFQITPLDANNVSNPLKWWGDNEQRFPHLSRLARDIFSIPGMFPRCVLTSWPWLTSSSLLYT